MIDDEALMSELREALRRRDAVTPLSREAARAAFTWRTVDEELLQLSHDSLAAGAALVRGPADADQARIVSFQGEDVSVELEVGPDQVIGQLLPGQSGSVTLQSPNGPERTVGVDAAGFFEFAELPSGPLRLRVEVAGRVLTTGWLSPNG